METLKVSSKSNPNSVAGALANLFKEKTSVLNPFGDLFINMMFIVIVPIIFLTITTTIAKMENPKRLGKIMLTILLIIRESAKVKRNFEIIIHRFTTSSTAEF